MALPKKSAKPLLYQTKLHFHLVILYEIDFVVVRRGKPPVAIEAKWKAGGAADYKNLLHFSRSHPESELVVVSQDIDRPFTRRSGEQIIHYKGLSNLIDEL